MIVSTDEDKNIFKIHCPFMKKVRLWTGSLCITKTVCDRPVANLMLSGEKLSLLTKAELRNKTRMPTLPLLFSLVPEASAEQPSKEDN